VCVPIGRRTELFWDQPIAIAARKDEIFARSRIMFDARKVTSRHNPVALFMLGGISAKWLTLLTSPPFEERSIMMPRGVKSLRFAHIHRVFSRNNLGESQTGLDSSAP